MSEMRANTDPGAPAGEQCVRQVLVTNQLGLHARPASQIAREAQAFAAHIIIAGQGQSVDAKSILDILTLSAAMGSTLEIRASGSDAAQAVTRLTELFTAKFGER
jgi:phosphocarrier protein HPr